MGTQVQTRTWPIKRNNAPTPEYMYWLAGALEDVDVTASTEALTYAIALEQGGSVPVRGVIGLDKARKAHALVLPTLVDAQGQPKPVFGRGMTKPAPVIAPAPASETVKANRAIAESVARIPAPAQETIVPAIGTTIAYLRGGIPFVGVVEYRNVDTGQCVARPNGIEGALHIVTLADIIAGASVAPAPAKAPVAPPPFDPTAFFAPAKPAPVATAPDAPALPGMVATIVQDGTGQVIENVTIAYVGKKLWVRGKTPHGTQVSGRLMGEARIAPVAQPARKSKPNAQPQPAVTITHVPVSKPEGFVKGQRVQFLTRTGQSLTGVIVGPAASKGLWSIETEVAVWTVKASKITPVR